MGVCSNKLECVALASSRNLMVDSRSTILESDYKVVIDTALVLIVVPLAQVSF